VIRCGACKADRFLIYSLRCRLDLDSRDSSWTRATALASSRWRLAARTWAWGRGAGCARCCCWTSATRWPRRLRRWARTDERWRGAAWRRCAEEEHRIIEWRFRVDDARRVFRYEGLTARRSEH